MASEEKSEGVVQGSGVVSFTQPTWRILNHRPSAVGEDGGAYPGVGEDDIGPSWASRESADRGADWEVPVTVTVADLCCKLLSDTRHAEYRSLVYLVPYAHEGREYHTFMRLDVPLLLGLRERFLPLVFLVDGGKEAHYAVRESEAEYSEFVITSTLAAGAACPSIAPFAGREGDPMAVLTFTQPGRGGCDQSGRAEWLGNHLLQASPNPGLVESTPWNTVGQDCGGAMTTAAMNAVVTAAELILEDKVSSSTEMSESDLPVRIVVASLSFGLASASRWLHTLACSGGSPVHALIDWEGPADSLDITLASQCTAPFGGRLLPWSVELAFEPSYDTWAAWFSGDWRGGAGHFPDTFFFRPPRCVLEQLTGEELVLLLGTPLARDPLAGDYWEAMYGPHAWGVARLEAFDEFWREREPIEHLPWIECPYVRIQADHDHIQPLWLWQRHAVKAINAALASGQHVFLAGKEYSSGGGLVPGEPTTLDVPFDDLSQAGWPDWIVSPGDSWPIIKSIVVIDLIRWAMAEDFYSKPDPSRR